MQVSAGDSIDDVIVAATENFARTYLVSSLKGSNAKLTYLIALADCYADSPVQLLLESTETTLTRVAQLELAGLDIFNNGECELIVVELPSSNFGGNGTR